jgi:hypothetical protein
MATPASVTESGRRRAITTGSRGVVGSSGTRSNVITQTSEVVAAANYPVI